MAERFCYGCMCVKHQSPVCEHCGYDERQLNQRHQLPIGTVLKNQYIIGRVLGQGGFGITYIGWDRVLNMRVAIKEYFPGNMVFRNLTDGPGVDFFGKDITAFEKQKERFLKEARTLAQLASVPQIVGVRNYFAENNTAYIVMEYVEGITLKTYVKQHGGRLSTEETLRILEPVLLGLQAVHDRQMIHRDISPDNIMMLPDGSIKLIDFGTARNLDGAAAKSTETILKPGYAPMEQYNSRGNLGPWTDVYALCATYYLCLTGSVPPDAPIRLDEGEDLPQLKSVKGLSKARREALEKGMELSASRRIQSLQQLHTLLYEQPPKPSGKKGRGAALLIGGAVAAAAVAVLLLSGPGKSAMPADISLEQGTGAQTASSAAPAAEETVPANLPPETTLSEAIPTSPAETEGYVSPDREKWEDNVMMARDVSRSWEFLGSDRVTYYDLTSVTFLDTLSGAPADSWDVSADGSGRVKAYVRGTDLYIAAEGGVNGAIACRELFYDCYNLKSIRFNGAFHTDDARDLSFMFAKCYGLTSLDLSTLYTGSAENMNSMFLNCSGLTELDLSGFVTSRVTDMGNMFASCARLTGLDLSGFDTSRVTDMRFLFGGCIELTELNIRGWNTAAVTDMTGMFQRLQTIQTLDVSGLNTASVSSMQAMFYGCYELKRLDLSGFDTSRVTNMTDMLSGCDALQDLHLGSWETGSVLSFDRFYSEDTLPDGRKWQELFT